MIARACAWMGTLAAHARVLVVWWSLWTLADTYLVPYTPQSELCLLGAVVLSCAVSGAVPGVARGVARGVGERSSECGTRWSARVEAWLARATQTAPAGQQYGEQRDCP